MEGGNPDYIARRNLSFRSSIMEGFVRAEFNFFPYGIRSAAYQDAVRWRPEQIMQQWNSLFESILSSRR